MTHSSKCISQVYSLNVKAKVILALLVRTDKPGSADVISEHVINYYQLQVKLLAA